jgi:tetratricopeptide (TPR) repeat protein
VEPGGPIQFTRPAVLLANRASASGADTFVLAMRVLPHVTVAGDVTEGALSAQFPEKLPNGWTLWVAFKVIRDHDGVCWDGVGVPPDLRVCNTAQDVAVGRDRVLEFAVQFLGKGLPAPQGESDSLRDLKTSLVQEYVRAASERGADAAIAQLHTSRADKGGAHFFGADEAIQTAGLFIRRKQFPEALGLLQVFREEYPKVAEGYVMLAEALLGTGDLAAAESALKDGEQVEAMFPWEKQQFNQARTALRKAKQGSAADVLGKALAEGGIPAAEKTLKDLMARRPEGPVFDEGDFNGLGYKLLGENNLESAVFVMEKTAELYPGSWNAWDSLGEVLANAGRKDRAIESYRKSLELNPKSKSGREMLQKLENAQ